MYEHQTPTIDVANSASHARHDRMSRPVAQPVEISMSETKQIDRIRLDFGRMANRIERRGQHGDRQQDGPAAGDLAAESPEQQQRRHARQIRDQPQRPFAGAEE